MSKTQILMINFYKILSFICKIGNNEKKLMGGENK